MTGSGHRCRTAGPARSRCRRGSFPIRRGKIRKGKADNVVPFKVCGATCDSVDILSRPFWLPETVDTGDWIEIGHIGAYSLSLRTTVQRILPR
jgi:diaminopimelate decarboxylase